MKIILLLLISSLLLSSNGNIPYKNNILSSNDYILAKVHYKTKNYEEAYLSFNNLFTTNPNEKMISFYQGLSSYKLKKYDEALVAYERVLIIDPAYNRARVELGLTYLRLGLKKYAKEEFIKVLKQPIPKNVRVNIEKIIKNIDNEKIGLISTFIFELSFNDNVTSGSNGTYDFYIFGDKVTEDNPKKESDFSHMEIVSLVYSQELPNNLSLVHNLVLLNKGLKTEDDYNLQLISYKPTLYHTDKKNRYSLTLGYDYIKTGSDVTLTSLLFAPKYKRTINKRSYFETNLTYKDLSFDDKDDNFKVNALGLTYVKRYFLWKINLEKNIKKEDNSSSYENIFGLNDRYKKYNFSTAYTYKKKIYEKLSTLFNSKREDIMQKLELKAKYLLSKKSNLSLKYENIHNSSNQKLYSYDKNNITINYTRSFLW